MIAINWRAGWNGKIPRTMWLTPAGRNGVCFGDAREKRHRGRGGGESWTLGIESLRHIESDLSEGKVVRERPRKKSVKFF